MRYVLFVCTHNAGRSQMAQAFFERDAPQDVRAESAGSDPANAIWPGVIEAMREVGIDLAERRPRKLLPEMQLHADWAVTMGCGDVCPYVPTTVEAWDIPDPGGLPLAAVRPIRDLVEERVRELIDSKLDAIRSDPTAHRARLVRMLPSLREEFEGTRTPEEIRACADAVLSRYDDVPIRGHVMALAHRRTSECLRSERCDELVRRAVADEARAARRVPRLGPARRARDRLGDRRAAALAERRRPAVGRERRGDRGRAVRDHPHVRARLGGALQPGRLARRRDLRRRVVADGARVRPRPARRVRQRRDARERHVRPRRGEHLDAPPRDAARTCSPRSSRPPG